MVVDRTQLKTILYVDDEADIREIVQMALGIAQDLSIHTCESGEHALALMLELKPDLLLLDVMMSGIDGPTTLTRMRQDPQLANIPVAFMTAKAMPKEVARFREMGAIGVISKPFNPMTLHEQVFALWEKAPQLPPSLDDPAMQQRLTELSAQFLHRTLEDLAGLRELLSSGNAAEVATLKQVERLAHRIRGAGAALGFDTVSHCAEEIERLAEGSLRADSTPDPQVARRLARGTARLGGVVEKLVQGLSSKGQPARGGK
jgi:two-component system OmpR family response regulator